MFKKIKDNEVYKKYKEYKEDPQNKAKISLVFWCILFVIIILLTRVSFGGTSRNRTVKYDSIYSYEYILHNDKVKLFGNYCNGKHDFIFNNNKYYYNGSLYEIIDNNLNMVSDFSFNYFKIDVSFIDDLTKNVSSTDNGYKRYLIPLINFISFYDGDTPVDVSNTDNYNIVIDKYFDNDVLRMVKIDLSSYYSYKGISDEGIIVIDFYNVNNVSDFSFEYEKMIGVK